jgi:DNA-binding transcriptional MerR regulator
MADQYTPEEIRAIFEEYNNAVKSGTPITAEMTARFKDASAGIKNYTAQLNASLKSLGSSVAGFVGAMKDGKQGAAAYNDSINAFADAIDSFLSRFGFLGKMLGTVLTAGARYTAEVNKQSDALFDAYKNLSQSGLSDAGGMRTIFDNMQKFGYGIEQLGEMTALLKENSKELAAFGGTAASGTKAFADAAADIQRSEVGKSLQMLGKTPDEINKGMAGFIKQQQMLGISSANINQNLAQKSADYVKQLDLISKLTGENADQLQAKLEQAQAEDAFAAAQYELKRKADAGDREAAIKYAANQELAQRLTGTALKEFQQGVGGDIAAMSKTLMTAPEAVATLSKSVYTADQYLTALGKGAERTMEQTSGLARLNANDFVLPFSEMGKAASRFADETSEQQKARAKAEQELQQKGLEPGTKAQVELRIEQMKTRDSLQSLINKGIVPVTTAMQKLAGATETVVGAAPGTTPATGAQIGGSTSPGVVSGKSVTIGGQTRSGGDRNWRNNNPGNIEYGPFAIKYGAIGSDGRFAIFPTEEQGRMAQDALLKSKNYANLSLSDAIKRYAPSNENDPKSYANQIMKATGIDTSKTYASLSPEEQGKVLDAMKKIEGGRAGVVSGPNGGYQSKTSGLNPSASLPTASSSNAPATVGSDQTQSYDKMVELLEQSNRIQSEQADALGRIRQNTAVG